MPTRKQRRRQQKTRRHEYEFVYVDDDGNEVEVDPSEVRPEKSSAKSETRARSGNGRRPAANQRAQRGIEPPSWRRAARRGLIFGPLLVIVMILLNSNSNVSPAQQIAPAIFLIAFFIPFSYFTDSLAYRMYQRRLARRDAAKTTR